jgi:hypothetical protein
VQYRKIKFFYCPFSSLFHPRVLDLPSPGQNYFFSFFRNVYHTTHQFRNVHHHFDGLPEKVRTCQKNCVVTWCVSVFDLYKLFCASWVKSGIFPPDSQLFYSREKRKSKVPLVFPLPILLCVQLSLSRSRSVTTHTHTLSLQVYVRVTWLHKLLRMRGASVNTALKGILTYSDTCWRMPTYADVCWA